MRGRAALNSEGDMDVVTRQEAETFLDLPSGEGGKLLDRIIGDVSAMLAAETGREDWGASSERTEYRDGGESFVTVDYWPITSVASIYEDGDHDWGSNTLVDSGDYHAGEQGIIWLETGSFVDGAEAVKITYTGGYASASAVPEAVKAAALRQVEHEWNRRKRQGGRADIPAGQTLPEVATLLQRYTRKIPFA